MPRLTADVALVGGADLAARGMGFLASVHMASSLGREGFGAVTVGLSVLSYVIWFADLGLAALGARETARPVASRRFTPATIASTRLLSGLIVLAIAALLLHFIPFDHRFHLLLLLFILPVIPNVLSLEWLHQGRRRFVPVAVGRIVNSLIFLCGVMILIATPDDLDRVPLVYGAGLMGAALVLMMLPRGGESIVPRRDDRAAMWPAWRTASKIGVGGLFAQSVQLFPPIALGWFSTDQAGLLGAATKFIFAALMIDRVFGALFLPAISSLWSRDRDGAERQLQIVLRLMIAAALLAATLITLCARPALFLVFKAEYVEGDITLAILGWFVAATLINSLFSFGLIAAGGEKEYLRASMFGGVVAAIASIVLSWKFGSAGAAVAMTIGEIVLVLFAWIAFRRRVKLHVLQPIFSAVVVSTLIVVPLRLSGIDSLWLLAIVPPVYLLLLFLGRGVRMDDLLWLLKR